MDFLREGQDREGKQAAVVGPVNDRTSPTAMALPSIAGEDLPIIAFSPLLLRKPVTAAPTP